MAKNELVVLGLLSEKPMYGYQLYQEIEKREMEHWAQVNLASIYNTLNRLQKDKLIQGKGEKPGRMPERKVYHLTPRGGKKLEELVEKALNESRMPQDSSMVGVAFLHVLSRDKILVSLLKKREKLVKIIRRIEKIYEEEHKNITFNWKFLIEEGISHLETHIKMIEKLINLVKRDKTLRK
ncbi:MAG: PadR family transcriptional regulator [candidate division Zixibacteria bacterium]|nr:PadR family transcriptional regulator [candidate division Zixibacteria bacterium]